MSKSSGNSLQLDKLPIHKHAYISSVNTSNSFKRRLSDLGFVPGTSITPIYRSPLGDPIAYKVMGAVIALRNRTASEIIVKLGADIYG